MLPYYILLFAPLACSLYAQHGKITVYNKLETKEQKHVIGIFFSVFFLMLALRGLACGCDTRNYLYYFNVDISLSFDAIIHKYKIEVLFHLLNKAISLVSKEFQFYLVIVAVMCIIPLWKLYKAESELPYLSIILFLTVAPFSIYFSGLRQALAVSIAPIAYYYCKKKKLLPYIATCLIATLFHQSAIMLFLMYPIYRAKITRNWLCFVVPIMAMTLVLNSRIYTMIVPLMGERYYERYGATSSTGAYSVILLLLVLAIFAILVPNDDQMDDDTIGLRNLLFLSGCLQCFSPVNTIAMRMNYYYLIFVPLTISKVITRSKRQYRQLAYFATVAMCGVFLLYFIYQMYKSSDIMQLYPYVGFWQNR